MKRLLLLIVIASTVVGCSTYSGTVSFSNLSSQKIARASVWICGQQFELENLAAGHKTEFKYQVKSDSHFIVNVTFESNKTLAAEGGYVTNGANFAHEIVVGDNGINIVLLKAR